MIYTCDPDYQKSYNRVYEIIKGDSSSKLPTSVSPGLKTSLGHYPDPDFLAKSYENSMGTGDRKSSGTFYTPPEVVRFMCRDTLAHYISNSIGHSFDHVCCLFDELLNDTMTTHTSSEEPYEEHSSEISASAGVIGSVGRGETVISAEMIVKADRALENIRLCDPAAGCGAFIIGVLDEIVSLRNVMTAYICSEEGADNRLSRIKRHPFRLKYNAVRKSIYGVDVNPTAVEVTRLRMWYALISEYEQYVSEVAALKVTSDEYITLIGIINRNTFGSFLCNIACADSLLEYNECGFDAVIGNPPYISAVEASKSRREVRQALKKKYPQLKGAFDIYAAFLLDGIRKTSESGVYCWIVPNKLLVSQYAVPVLEYLKENGLKYSISVSDIGVFSGIGVYPVIITGNKHSASSIGLTEYSTRFTEYTTDSLQHLTERCLARRPDLKQYKTFSDHSIRIASGAAGFQARSLKQYISEAPSAEYDTWQDVHRSCKNSAMPFAVSGSIDKYRLNRNSVRYMGTTYRKPLIIKGDKIAESKWDLWCAEKICIAGLTKEIEAYYSREPLALGVGAYAIYDFGGFDPLYLLALLNSRFMSWYLSEKFYERHLSGDYMAINKSTLEQLPLVSADEAVQKEIARKAGILLELFKASDVDNAEVLRLLREIDEMVYRVFDLNSSEIDVIQNFL